VTTPPEEAAPPERHHRRPRVQRLLGVLLSPSKFAIVGVLGIVVNQVVLYVATEFLGIFYLISVVIASQVSTFNNFVLTEAWVFHFRESRHGVVFRYLVFNALNTATLLVRLPVVYLLTDRFGVNYLVSNLIAIGLTFGVRYFVADNWIWAGRDQRDQVARHGSYNYDVHGIVRIRSAVNLPELAAFNVDREVTPDLEVRRRRLGGRLRAHVATWREGDVVHYREHLGPLSAAFDVTFPGGPNSAPVLLDANWLLAWSHHVLYTNMVEPLLRFILIARGHALLHCAAVDAEHGAIVMSAQTDTGKTSAVLRLLMHHSWGFISDDMAIVGPDGTIRSYPKPMTLSSHTMSAVNERRLPFADRVMLAVRSRVHSKQGRSLGHSLGRANVPIVTINAWVQLLVPPPKYHVTSLVDCEMSDSAPIDSVILMERGDPLCVETSLADTLDELLANTEDAYTFPPFHSFAPEISVDGLDHPTLLLRERAILSSAVEHVWRIRLRVTGHGWSDAIPSLVAQHNIAISAPPERLPERATVANPVA
jgi:dolichol-phosphate mannosyltransferase